LNFSSTQRGNGIPRLAAQSTSPESSPKTGPDVGFAASGADAAADPADAAAADGAADPNLTIVARGLSVGSCNY